MDQQVETQRPCKDRCGFPCAPLASAVDLGNTLKMDQKPWRLGFIKRKRVSAPTVVQTIDGGDPETVCIESRSPNLIASR